MVRKIGNILTFTFIFLFSVIFANNEDKIKFQLKAKDYNLNELNNAEIGCPFIIELTVEGSSDLKGNPVIKNLDMYEYSNKGISSTISNINGVTKIKKIYKYEIRIDNEGTYQFGPIEINNKIYDSILNIEVKKEQKTKNADSSKNILLKLSVDKDVVYLNEAVEVSLRFLYKNENINILNYEIPKLTDFNIDNEKLTSYKQEQINNDFYSVNEIRFFIYPKKLGTLIIPSFKAYFEEPMIENRFFGFFGPQFETKEIISNSLKINVIDLPNFNEKIHGVGSFKNFKATLNQNVAMQNEGVVLKIELDGKADLDNLNIDLNLPSDIKYYESKNYVEKLDNGYKRKILEYVLQCSQIGKIEIPSQQFNFFDPKNRRKGTLKTNPMFLEINRLISENKNEQNYIADDIVSIKDEIYYEKPNNYISNKWFIFLLIIPIMLQLFSLSKKIIKFNNANPIDKAIKKLKAAKRKDSYDEIYNIFMQYFIEKYEIATHPIVTQEFIKEKLKQAQMAENLIDEWQEYFNELTEVTFFRKKVYNQEIFKKANYWLKIFKKLL